MFGGMAGCPGTIAAIASKTVIPPRCRLQPPLRRQDDPIPLQSSPALSRPVAGSDSNASHAGTCHDNRYRILRINTVLERTGLSRSTLYRKIQQGTFPRADRHQHAVRRMAGLRGRRVDEEPDVLLGRGLSREVTTASPKNRGRSIILPCSRSAEMSEVTWHASSGIVPSVATIIPRTHSRGCAIRTASQSSCRNERRLTKRAAAFSIYPISTTSLVVSTGCPMSTAI
jgi:hypothetical protein